MSRSVLAVMAGLLCALAGVKHAAALKSDASRLSRWGQLLKHLTLLLHEGAMSIPQALCAAADGHAPPDKLLRDVASKLAANPLLSLTDAFIACHYDSAERDVLARLFSRLGHGTKEARCLALEQTCAELELLAHTASIRADKDARLWQTLGFIGGACLTILLL